MSYGHADKIIAAAAGTPAADSPPIDPALYQRDDMREVLAVRDVTALYLALKAAGIKCTPWRRSPRRPRR